MCYQDISNSMGDDGMPRPMLFDPVYVVQGR